MYTVNSHNSNPRYLTLTQSNTNFCFASDHFYIILPSITRTMFKCVTNKKMQTYRNDSI